MRDQLPMRERNWRNLIFSGWDVLLIRSNTAISTFFSHLSLSWQGCRVGQSLTTSGHCSFKARRPGTISIGEHVTFLAYWRSNRVGLNGRVILQTLGDGQISIGNRSGASAVVISARKSISIGENCKIGGNVRIFDHDFHSMNPSLRRSAADRDGVRAKPVCIGNDVFIGTNAIILKGVTIGDRAIIGAGAVITFDVLSDSVVTWSRSAFQIRPVQTRNASNS